MADININFGRPKPRRRRRRVAGGLVGLIALAIAAFFAKSKLAPPAAPESRLPAAPAALAKLRATELGKGLEPIPATVIDQGIFRRVPYLSHRAGEVELNVYGDPDFPAAIEIGLTGDPARRAACRDALADLVPDPAARAALSGLDLAKGKASAGGYTVEVTPETAPDAYGAWWVSVYLPKELEAVRASDGELKDVSQPRPADAKRSRPGKDVYANDVVRQANKWLRRR
jgi:hypothetical protein